jgi:hypothetical protein
MVRKIAGSAGLTRRVLFQEAYASIYTFIESAKHNGIVPQAWLAYPLGPAAGSPIQTDRRPPALAMDRLRQDRRSLSQPCRALTAVIFAVPV